MPPRAPQFFKALAGLFGAGLCVVGLWYVFHFLLKIDVYRQLAALDGTAITALIVLTACLAGANALIALGWRSILADCGAKISFGRAQKLFGVTNLGKYVPGNVLHVIGRQVLAMREGVPSMTAAKSLSLEIVLLITTSATFAGAVWFLTRFEGLTGALLATALLLSAVGGVLLLRGAGLKGSARASIAYCVYHLIGGGVFAVVFMLLGAAPGGRSSFGFIVMAYVASWVLGLVTPGAPAGLGVREALLIGFLQHTVSDQTALGTAVLLSRGMSVTADIAYFCVLQLLSVGRFRENLNAK